MSISTKILRSMCRSLPAVGGFVISLAFSTPLLAADAKKEATKHLKQVAASVLKDFKLLTKAHRGELVAELDVLDAQLKLGTSNSGKVAEIAAALDSFQSSVRSALDQAESGFSFGKAGVLAELSSAGITAVADLPSGFLDGGGSIADAHRAAILRAVDDLYEGVTLRVRKTADLFEKELGFAVTFRVRAPYEYEQRTTGALIGAPPLTIDVIVAASSLTATNDGVVYLYGFANDFDGSMTIGMSITGAVIASVATVTANASDRWSFAQSNLPEGDRMYSIHHPTESAGAARASITVP